MVSTQSFLSVLFTHAFFNGEECSLIDYNSRASYALRCLDRDIGGIVASLSHNLRSASLADCSLSLAALRTRPVAKQWERNPLVGHTHAGDDIDARYPGYRSDEKWDLDAPTGPT
ncbi:hypothetical protein MBM_07612 [Drepanopeziza brunnea f. sp. 'multigermtubi' MB_m1]|uniref:Uncharacterized protein n=1 Tax=Marssonina brunnea f. sp. multigermtubi (strain MB_m1) TaxID=1072389 RepID=K1WPS6_MARBU|nr:uncharacterized protein MBM_07612 [Drepanopeziza brunnea f. sp. 'multigermtubi' MB_m1]EKD14382.1 hypothetical protein MBM_07612 [Drepanopeziza brunnea f. sp. 'multigermtubi' MB_m1]